MGFAVLEFVGIGKANPCADQTQKTDEGCVEDIHTSFVGMIAKGIVANPLYGVKHEQGREKSQVIDDC
jgi:hypothetical protein